MVLGSVAMSDQTKSEVNQCPPGQQAASIRASCVLIAEDDEDMRALLAHTLRTAGYSVIECADGLELMEHVSSLLGKHVCRHIDLVVSDVRMPWVTGLEVLRCTNDYLGYPPFVLITAFPDEETRVQAKQLGAALMLSKPFDMDYFLEVVRTIVPVERRWTL
jgi:CheY-like chemotaxis protein